MNRQWNHHLDLLHRLISKPRFGIISDFDGTLSPLAALPQDAVIAPANAQALDSLAKNVTVIALVSGRGVADLHQRYKRSWLVYYGNHGMECWRDGSIQIALEAQQWLAPLQALIGSLGEFEIPGVVVENKGITASVHYRMTPEPETARHVILARLQPLCDRYGFRLSEGQFVWEIKPPVDLSKGTAACTIVEDCRLESVLFMGDDLTDIAAMRQLHALAEDPQRNLRALSVGVLRDTSPIALSQNCDLTAAGVADVAALLAWISQNRAPASTTSTT